MADRFYSYTLIYAINLFMPPNFEEVEGGHIGFGLSVPIRPFVTLFDAYHARKGFEIS